MAVLAFYFFSLFVWAVVSVAFRRWEQPLKRASVLRLVLATILTFGYFYPIWFLRRRAALNAMDSPRKLAAWPYFVVLTFMITRDLLLILYGATERPPEWLGLVTFPLVLLLVIQTFFARDILQDALIDSTEAPALQHFQQESRNVSGLLTFFFGIFYLQHIINTRIVVTTSTWRPAAASGR